MHVKIQQHIIKCKYKYAFPLKYSLKPFNSSMRYAVDCNIEQFLEEVLVSERSLVHDVPGKQPWQMGQALLEQWKPWQWSLFLQTGEEWDPA